MPFVFQIQGKKRSRGGKFPAPAVFFPLYLKHKGYILRLINK